jgi:nitronate monooxygenase
MISTRLTKFFGIEHPIILAPMTPAAGADLSEAVAAAGGSACLAADTAIVPGSRQSQRKSRATT